MESVKESVPVFYKIKEIRNENYRIKSFVFEEAIKAKPGQFVMLWLSGENEKPFAISNIDPFMLTIAAVGEFSKKVCSTLKKGEKVGIRGPYGNSFSLKGKKIMLIVGGYGIATVKPLAKEAAKKRIETTIIMGARKKEDIIMENEFEKINCKVIVSTDDGSRGFKGRATEAAENELKRSKDYDSIYSVGPEMMMLNAISLAQKHKLYCEVSAERFFKCGIGICGACSLSGLMVCRDGTVFNGKQLENTAFGKFRLDASGRKISLH